MATDTAGLSSGAPNCGLEWYVHKHRHEHEAAIWDERRLQVQVEAEVEAAAPVVVNHLLIKFVLCAVALTATLGVVVTVIR